MGGGIQDLSNEIGMKNYAQQGIKGIKNHPNYDIDHCPLISWEVILHLSTLINVPMKKSVKVFHWLPRVICILSILFVSLFAADAFAPELTIWQQLVTFIIHLIPSFILLVFLIIAWKWEYIGGLIFIIIGLGLSPIVFMHNYKMNQSIGLSLGIIMAITIPFAIVGILFIVSHYQKKKNLLKTPQEE